MLLSVMFAPGRTAPLGSETVILTVASCCCAKRFDASSRTAQMITTENCLYISPPEVQEGCAQCERPGIVMLSTENYAVFSTARAFCHSFYSRLNLFRTYVMALGNTLQRAPWSFFKRLHRRFRHPVRRVRSVFKAQDVGTRVVADRVDNRFPNLDHVG